MRAFREALVFDGATADLWRLMRRWQLTNTRFLIGNAQFLDLLNEQVDPLKKRFKIAARFSFMPRPGIVKPRAAADVTVEANPAGDLAIFEFSGALPRAKLFTQWSVAPGDEAALSAIAAREFDPLTNLVVCGDGTLPKPAAGNHADDAEGKVTIASYLSRHVVLQASAVAPSVLLLNDRFDPNWKVSVDGVPVKLLRCNYLMRGVHLEPGAHRVEFDFSTSRGAAEGKSCGNGNWRCTLGRVCYEGLVWPKFTHLACCSRPNPSKRQTRSQTARRKSSSTYAKSAGTVTFGFGPVPVTSLTGWPISSQAAVSSVTLIPFSRARASARRMTSTRKVCGVCTAQSRDRSTVREMSLPSPDSLIVSVTASAATAAPIPRAAAMVARRDERLVRAGARAVLNGDNFSRGRQRLQTVPDRVLAFRAARHESARFVELPLLRQFLKFRLHAVPHHQHDFIHGIGFGEALPSVRDDRPARDFQKKFVDVRPHAGAPAGGDDNGGNHGVRLPVPPARVEPNWAPSLVGSGSAADRRSFTQTRFLG